MMGSRCFAFFDVDHTIISCSSGKHLAVRAIQQGILPAHYLLKIPRLYLRYRTGMLEPGILSELLRKLEGISMERIRRMVADIFDVKIKPKIYAEALRRIGEERSKGRTVVLATSSPEFLVAPIAEYLGVSEVVATKFKVRDGMLTGEFDGAPAFGEGKLSGVLSFAEEHNADLGCSSFYSDSHYDLPLFRSVGEAVAVNPDRKLCDTARKEGWKILIFRDILGKTGVQQDGTFYSGD